MTDPTFDGEKLFCPGHPFIIVTEDNGSMIVAFDKSRSSAEMGIAIADIFKHMERGRGREFVASVWAMLYKELTNPTSGHTEIKL